MGRTGMGFGRLVGWGRGVGVAVAITAATAAAVVGGAPNAVAAPPNPVAALDLQRYLGSWDQLAAIPAYFNLVCARDTQAHYSLDPAGNVTVRNNCTTWANTPNVIVGTATINDRATNAQLHVSFPGVPTQEQLHGPTNYIVTGLGADYSWAVVTDPFRLSGFVLSRTPALSVAQWHQVRTAIEAAGIDTCAFLTSPTTGGIGSVQPLCSA